MSKTYLLSRAYDPLLGVFTGVLAFYLHETNPRSAPPPGHTLRELVGWRWGVMKSQREARDRLVGEDNVGDWERLLHGDASDKARAK